MQLGVSPRDRRTLGVGAVVIAALFAFAKAAPALSEWTAMRTAEAAALVTEASRASAGRRALPLLRDSLAARLTRLSTLDSSMISAPSTAAASAELASVLADLAEESRFKVSSLQLRGDTAGALVRIGVRMTGVSDVTGLAALLFAIEGGERLLAVRELTVAQAEPMASPNQVEALRIDLLIEGLTRIAAGARR